VTILWNFEKQLYSSTFTNTLPEIRVSIFTIATSLTSVGGKAVHSVSTRLLPVEATEQFRFVGMMNYGWLQESQTYWLPVTDNWNRGTKMEDRDKRNNKGRIKPVTVRRVLPPTYCGFKTRLGGGNIYTFICAFTVLCRWRPCNVPYTHLRSSTKCLWGIHSYRIITATGHRVWLILMSLFYQTSKVCPFLSACFPYWCSPPPTSTVK